MLFLPPLLPRSTSPFCRRFSWITVSTSHVPANVPPSASIFFSIPIFFLSFFLSFFFLLYFICPFFCSMFLFSFFFFALLLYLSGRVVMTRLMNIRSCDMMIDWSSYMSTLRNLLFLCSLLLTYISLFPIFLCSK